MVTGVGDRVTPSELEELFRARAGLLARLLGQEPELVTRLAKLVQGQIQKQAESLSSHPGRLFGQSQHMHPATGREWGE